MEIAATYLRWATGCCFTVLGFAGARRAFRARPREFERTALGAAIGLLGLTSFLGRIQEATSYRIPLVSEVSLAAFMGTGFCLLLVRHGIFPMSRRALRTALGACVFTSLLVVAAHLPTVRNPNFRPTHVQLAAVLLLFLVWTACVGEPAYRFFKMSQRAPRIQRRRARALGTCYAGLALILDGAILVGARANSATAFALGLCVAALIPMLWIAAIPPRWIRNTWRARESTELRAGITAMLKLPANEMASTALDMALRVVGGDGGIISLPDGTLSSSNMTDDEAAELAAIAGACEEPSIVRSGGRVAIVAKLRLESGPCSLAVRSGPLTPVFGDDEVAILDGYATALAGALDRTRLLDALRHETARSNLLLESLSRLNEAILVVENGEVVYANEALQRLNGYSYRELQTIPFMDIVVPGERSAVAERMRRRLAGESVEDHYETVIRHKDGHEIEIEVAVQILQSNGNTQILSICRDITERKRSAEREARRVSELAAFSKAVQKLTGTLDAEDLGAGVAACARDVIGAERAAFVTYADGDVQRVYPAGIDEGELERAGVLRAEDGYLGRLLAAGKPVRVAQLHRVPRASGPASARAYSFLAIPVIRGTQMRAVLCLAGKEEALAFDDIDENVASGLANYATEAFEAAQAFMRERAAVERLEELDEMKNSFISALSHELRTPLTSVIGFAQTLEDETTAISPQDRTSMLHRLTVNARRLERLLGDLLDVDRLRRGISKPVVRPTDLSKLVLRVLEEFELGAGRTINLDAGPVVIDVDAAKVERIVENLLANAMKHTAADTPVWVRCVAADGGAMLVVEDAGEGVPADMREHIFEAFAQGPRVAKHSPGVGIGLSLVARFAELHGGRAWVEDRPGGGASFRVFFPGEVRSPAVEERAAERTIARAV
jgi:PAS domain S-box-containing protein